MPKNFSNDELNALPFVISTARFSTYLRVEGQDVRRALALYRWNVELSAAFFMPLQICEIALRNAVVGAIEVVHGPNWPWLKGFNYSLPLKIGNYEPRRDLGDVARRRQTPGQVVAELKFMFWQSMFLSGQDTRVWNAQLYQVFPGMPAQATIPAARQLVHDEIQTVRRLRNRIAHHEPIFTRDIVEEIQRINKIIRWRSPIAADWVERTQTVTEVIARRPRQGLDGSEFLYPVRC